MRYKVGDRVRRIKDVTNEMPVGTIVTIKEIIDYNNCQSFSVKEKKYVEKEREYKYYWCSENFELAGGNSTELLNAVKPTELLEMISAGDIRNRTKIYCSDFVEPYYFIDGTLKFKDENDELVSLTLKDFFENSEYVLYYIKEGILTDSEKEYLRNVIKYVVEPTGRKVESICKYEFFKSYEISINFRDGRCIPLPDFEGKEIYEGMELGKEYTLEDLEIGDE